MTSEIINLPIPDFYPDELPPKKLVPVYCSRSGVTLGAYQLYITEGYDPLAKSWNSQDILHPFYGLHHVVLRKKLDAALTQAMDFEWNLTNSQQLRIQVLLSALLWEMDVIKQDRPTIPPFPIAAGSADRILQFSNWYLEKTSRRKNLPVFSVSSLNNNLDWRNLKVFVDELYEQKKLWSKRVRELELAEQQEAATIKATDTIRKSVFKRLDLKKVWNWIHLQLDGNYPLKDIEAFKDLFLNGDSDFHEWRSYDVDCLVEAIVNCCDIGNDITSFIQDRLNAIRYAIEEFNSSFTLVASAKAAIEAEQTAQEKEMIAGLDAVLDNSGGLPPQPVRADYDSNVRYEVALSKWNLLKRRFDSRSAA